MINLEQVKLLETKVAKAIEYVERLTKENTALHRQEAELQARLESYQKRIDELEVLVMRFKEDQGQIETGILAALDRLSQFEKDMEKSLKEKPSGEKAAANEPAQTDSSTDAGAGDGQTCFEIPETADEDDIPDPLDSQDPMENTEEKGPSANADSSSAEGGELLDIF